MEKQTVYYAHFMGLYNTFQEDRDVKLLESLGFRVINPNTPETSEAFQVALHLLSPDGEGYEKAFDAVFGDMVRECDILAYKPLPDGRISAGVVAEIKIANDNGKPVISLPNETDLVCRAMSVEETRAYLRDMGVR